MGSKAKAFTDLAKSLGGGVRTLSKSKAAVSTLGVGAGLLAANAATDGGVGKVANGLLGVAGGTGGSLDSLVGFFKESFGSIGDLIAKVVSWIGGGVESIESMVAGLVGAGQEQADGAYTAGAITAVSYYGAMSESVKALADTLSSSATTRGELQVTDESERGEAVARLKSDAESLLASVNGFLDLGGVDASSDSATRQKAADAIDGSQGVHTLCQAVSKDAADVLGFDDGQMMGGYAADIEGVKDACDKVVSDYDACSQRNGLA